MMYLTYCMFAVLIVVAMSAAKPLEDHDELAKSELQSQEVSYHVEPARERPLQRAITFTDKLLVPLEFTDSAKKKPRKKNLKASRLLRKMGEDFDEDWMRIERPAGRDGKAVQVHVEEKQVAKLVEQVAQLNLEEELLDLDENLNSNDIFEDETTAENVRGQMIAVFQQWLVRKSSCPVAYQWKDLGEYFWPRWVRQGGCGDSLKKDEDDDDDDMYEEDDDEEFGALRLGKADSVSKACSWPMGMKCVPGKAKTLHILRWHCRRRKTSEETSDGRHRRNRRQSRHKCKWYKVPYPVTSNCKCACKE